MPSHPGDEPGTRHRKRVRQNASSKSAAPKRVHKVGIYIIRNLAGTQIRMCYGYGNFIKVPASIPLAPHNVVQARKEFRQFTDEDGRSRVTSNKQFVHYHLRRSCVLKKNPTSVDRIFYF